MGRQPGSAGSGVRFEFPKNYFVWGFLKGDSQPYKPTSVLHIFFGLGQNRPSAPPDGQRGPGIFFSSRPPPSPACTGWVWGHFSEPAYRAPPPARSPTCVPRQRNVAPPRCCYHSKERRNASRMVLDGSCGEAWPARCRRSKLGHVTRKPAQATRKRPIGLQRLKPPVSKPPQRPATGLRPPPGPCKRPFGARLRGSPTRPVTHLRISATARAATPPPPPVESADFPRANTPGFVPGGRPAGPRRRVLSGFRVASAALSGSFARSPPVFGPPAARTSLPVMPQAFRRLPPPLGTLDGRGGGLWRKLPFGGCSGAKL